eukprot:1583111-Alexandrium_andersonii.AAC.1
MLQVTFTAQAVSAAFHLGPKSSCALCTSEAMRLAMPGGKQQLWVATSCSATARRSGNAARPSTKTANFQGHPKYRECRCEVQAAAFNTARRKVAARPAF